MKALVKTKPGVGNVQLQDWPEPACTPSGVKVEVKYCGICGTDIHVFHDTFRNYPPVILGHEFSGVVAEVGPEIKTVKPGDRVAVLGSSMVICGKCEYCRQGNYIQCPTRRGMGHGVSGGFTKYVVVREDQIYHLPDCISLEEAALSEPFACAVQAIEECTDLHVGDTVLLSGPGPIGLLCLLLIQSHGCKVIVAGTDSDKDRLALCKKLGADVTVNINNENLEEVINRETHGKGADITVDCTGVAASINTCLKLAKSLGRHIQVGIAGKEITLDYDKIFAKKLTVFGSNSHSLKTWDRVMKIFEQQKIDLKPLISHKLPLSKWEEAFKLCEEKQGIKVLLYYDEK